jgi:hypothetical protein
MLINVESLLMSRYHFHAQRFGLLPSALNSVR